MTTGGGDFWSRRKAAVRDAENREALDRLSEENAEKTASLEEMTDEEVCRELELPDPDALEKGSDIKPFLQTIVPERLRRRALRRLWLLDPTLANVDGLVEYGEDFTDAATVLEGMQTTYQIGKGMLKHIEKLAENAEKLAESDVLNENADDDESMDSAVGSKTSSSPSLGEEMAEKKDGRVELTQGESLMHTQARDSVEEHESAERKAELIEPVVGGVDIQADIQDDAVELVAPDLMSVQSRRMRFSFS